MFFFDHAGRKQRRPASLSVNTLSTSLSQIMNYYRRSTNERQQTDVPPVWKQKLGADVLSALTSLSHGKCAFCEQKSVSLQVYRFRPPAYASPAKDPDDKSCYLWLTFNWSNFFPICEGCLPSDKTFFPIFGWRARIPSTWKVAETLLFGLEAETADRAVLYYPAEIQEPWSAFGIRLDGVLTPKEERAAATIKHFNLNRNDLIRRRKKALAQNIDFLVGKLPTFSDASISLSKAEFGGVHQLLLHRISTHLPPRIQTAIPQSGDTVASTLRNWSTGEMPDTSLKRAIRRIREEDTQSSPPKSALVGPTTARPSIRRTSRSRLQQVTIRNYKSLENISFSLPNELPKREPLLPDLRTKSDAPEAPCLLILGENATGKSSVLEAIAIACLRDETLRPLGLSDSTPLKLNPLYMGAERGATAATSEIRLSFHDGTNLRAKLKGKGRPALSPEASPRPMLFAYGSHRLFGKKARLGSIRHIDTLFRREREISNPAKWLKSLAKSEPVLNEVVSALRHIIQIDGEFENISVTRTRGDKEDHCYINIKKKKKDDSTFTVRQRLDIASSGYRAVLALVCDILQGLMQAHSAESSNKKMDSTQAHQARRSEAIVLIDEIEAHLHPRWKLNIMSGLRRAMPRVTFIVTSHDPLCLRGMYNGEVMMLNRYQNEGSNQASKLPEVVERVAEFDNIEDLTIEQLLTSNLFQLFSTDASWTDYAFSIIPTILTKRENREDLSDVEMTALRRFDEEIKEALPYGRTEITQLVREAVAGYVAERRSKGSVSAAKARNVAIDEIKKYLRGLLE